MINGNAGNFIDELYYQDHYAIFRGEKLFFNGCQCKVDNDKKIVSATLEIYNLKTNEVLFSTEQESPSECIKRFEDAPIFNGKTFWQAEGEIEWVDC